MALSGGVDSSVSAALLKKDGYDVTGVFIRVWQPDFLPCTWREERRDAMRVAAKLSIPFLTLNLEKEYKRDVVDYMIREYKAGRTPNPDVMCNKYVKFGAFYKKARAMGADFVATGHYAINRKTQNVKRKTLNSNSKLLIQGNNLLMATDKNKDQSYFLWTLNQEVLSHTFFPIGRYKKSEVRVLAKKFGLFTSDKKDSQGLCFVGKLNMKEFLSHFIKQKRGKVLNEKGEAIGLHNGAIFFTLGERHGFFIIKNSSSNRPFYVVSKNIKKNTVTVSDKPGQLGLVSGKSIKINGINWTAEIPKKRKEYKMQTRYHSPHFLVVFKKIGKNEAEILIKKGHEIIALGQSAVFYDNEVCLGGGVIN